MLSWLQSNPCSVHIHFLTANLYVLAHVWNHFPWSAMPSQNSWCLATKFWQLPKFSKPGRAADAHFEIIMAPGLSKRPKLQQTYTLKKKLFAVKTWMSCENLWSTLLSNPKCTYGRTSKFCEPPKPWSRYAIYQWQKFRLFRTCTENML